MEFEVIFKMCGSVTYFIRMNHLLHFLNFWNSIWQFYVYFILTDISDLRKISLLKKSCSCRKFFILSFPSIFYPFLQHIFSIICQALYKILGNSGK